MKKVSVHERARMVKFSLDESPAAPDSAAPSPAPVSTAVGASVVPELDPSKAARRPITGPGAFMNHLAQESKTLQENTQLKQELKLWDGALPAKRLATGLIKPSVYANRIPQSFENEDFELFVHEIQAAGGNTQPIKVRPIRNRAENSAQEYELIFGHRRWTACARLGIPVLAIIESVDDKVLFEEMDRENRGRQNLRPYEQGLMYQNALLRGLYPSLRKLADELDVAPSSVSTAIKLAELPKEIVEAFPSPLDLQFRWVTPLAESIAANSSAVTSKAKEIAKSRKAGKGLSAADTLSALVASSNASPVSQASAEQRIDVTLDSKLVATISTRKGGRTSVSFLPGTIGPDKMDDLKQLIIKLIS